MDNIITTATTGTTQRVFKTTEEKCMDSSISDFTSSEELRDLGKYLNSKDLRRLERQLRKENALSQQKQNKIINIANAESKSSPLVAKTQKQKSLIQSIYKSDQTFAIGSAGTGKTYVSASIACDMFVRGQAKKIVLTRPNVSTGKSIGFFPGSLEEKMAPWLAPFTAVFQERLGKTVYELAQKHGDIEIVPFEVIRGRNFQDCFVLLDEAQNTTIDEIRAFVTRLGEGSKMVISGDLAQSDIHMKNNGLNYIVEMVRTHTDLFGEYTSIVEFDESDIVRSNVCASWIRAFNRGM